MSATEASRDARRLFCRRGGSHASNLRRICGRFSLWGLVLPVGIVILISLNNFAWWRYTRPWQQEIYRPWILACGFLAATTFWVLRGEVFHRWLILATGTLYCCEVQLDGIWPAAYFMPFFLAWNLSLKYEQMQPYVESRLVVSLFGGGLVGYFLASIGRWEIWADVSSGVIWRSNLQESQATLGDMMITGAVIASEVLWRLGLLQTGVMTIPISSLRRDESIDRPDRRAA